MILFCVCELFQFTTALSLLSAKLKKKLSDVEESVRLNVRKSSINIFSLRSRDVYLSDVFDKKSTEVK